MLTHSEPTSIKNTLKISKYPIDKKSYESQLKSFEESKSVKDNDNEDDIYYNEDNIIQLGDKYSKKLFLEAYKTITLNDIKEKKIKEKMICGLNINMFI